ncbi:hypothetical protein D9M68_624170 [compost metagenome]
MRHQGRDPPAPWTQEYGAHGGEGQANETEQCQALLPEPLHRGTDACEQFHRGRPPGRRRRLALPGHGRGHRPQQRQALGGQGRREDFQVSHALGTEQLHQQRGAGGIQAAEPIQVHCLARRKIIAQAGDPPAQFGVVGQGPVPAYVQAVRTHIDRGWPAHDDLPPCPSRAVGRAPADRQNLCFNNTKRPP